MTSRLTVITGPAGVDLGAAVAYIGRDVADGMAVRVVDTTRDSVAHTSPDPFHRRRDPAVDHPGNRWITGRVRLRYLPSAWQDPQTNLAVVFTSRARPLANDIYTMASLGLNPSHRLTVQAPHLLKRGFEYPLPVEPGDVGVQARDSVLRTGGHVVVEAGDGMTHIEALAALRLPPWASWIGALDLWTVLEATSVERAVEDLATLGVGAPGIVSPPVTSNVLVMGVSQADALDVATAVVKRTGLHSGVGLAV